MEVLFQFVQLQRSERLEQLVREKLDKLENKYDWIVRSEVHFKRQEEQNPMGYICNINVSVPGPQIFAESNENSFEAAAAESVRDIEKQLAKKKSQMKSHH